MGRTMWPTLLRAMGWPFRRPGYLLLTAGEEGLATWVLAHGQPQLVRDELGDPRIHQFASTGDIQGSLICVPLLGRDGVRGVISLERLGDEERFDEVVKLPSRIDMLGKIGMMMASPLVMLLRTLQAPLVNAGLLLGQLKDKKSKETPA